MAQPIRYGSGLLRCCVRWIERYAPDNPTEGDRLACDHCSGDIRFHFGKWEHDYLTRARRALIRDIEQLTADRTRDLRKVLSDE